MRTTTRTLAGAAMGVAVLLAGCASRSADSPAAVVSSTSSVVSTTVPTTSAPTTTTATTTPVTSAAPTTAAAAIDTSRLDQMLTTLDGQLNNGSKALDDATAAIDSGEGDVNP